MKCHFCSCTEDHLSPLCTRIAPSGCFWTADHLCSSCHALRGAGVTPMAILYLLAVPEALWSPIHKGLIQRAAQIHAIVVRQLETAQVDRMLPLDALARNLNANPGGLVLP